MSVIRGLVSVIWGLALEYQQYRKTSFFVSNCDTNLTEICDIKKHQKIQNLIDSGNFTENSVDNVIARHCERKAMIKVNPIKTDLNSIFPPARTMFQLFNQSGKMRQLIQCFPLFKCLNVHSFVQASRGSIWSTNFLEGIHLGKGGSRKPMQLC